MANLNLLDPDVGKTKLTLLELIAGRMTHVQVLAIGAVLMGLTLGMTGHLIVPLAPTFGSVPGWPWVVGAPLAGSGAVVVYALARGRHLLAVVGAAVAAASYLALAGGFLALWLVWLSDPTPASPLSPPYPAVGWLMVATLHALHAVMEWHAHERDRIDRILSGW